MQLVLVFVTALAIITISNGELDESKLSDETKELGKNIRKTCLEESHVDEDVVNKADEGHFDDEDENFKCYAKCVMRESGAMDDNGDLHAEAIIEHLPDEYKEPIKEMFEHCSKIKDDNLCHQAYKFFKCNYDHDPEHFFVI